MTCIVGIAENGVVYMGADSAAGERSISQPHKIFRIGGLLIGYTTSWRMGQILEHHLDVEDHEEGWTDMAYLVRCFIPAVRKCLQEQGYTKIENNQEEAGSFLVGYHGHLYHVFSNFQVLEMTDGFDACGYGEDFALGAMYVLGHSASPPRMKIFSCLKAAAHFSGYIQEPFYIETSPSSVSSRGRDDRED